MPGFLSAIDLKKNELRNAVIQNLASAPASPLGGQVYYDTALHRFMWYRDNDTTWIDSLARANHTGTQLAATISDFDSQVNTHTINQLTAPTADFSMNSHKITNVTDPTSAQDAATKNYVDTMYQGLSWKDSVRAATTANGTLATAFANGQVIDGVTLATGDRILIKNQTTQADNGVYTVNASGAPTRATDADTGAEIKGASMFVEEGTTNGDTAWILTTNAPITLGSTSLSFAQFGAGSAYVAGAGLTLTGTTFDVVAGDGSIIVNADELHVATAAPVASAIGDTQATGSAATIAKSDHRHARESAGAPVASAVGDTQATGSGPSVAYNDHKHAREAFGNVVAVSFGDASANGSAVTVSHSDHSHGLPFNPEFKQTVRVATTGSNITLAGSAPNTLDGVSLAANDRILVKDQSTASQNGIYIVQTVGTGANGTWVRATDADNTSADTELRTGALIPVSEGTVGADTVWMLTTNGSITIATTSLAFSQVGGKFATNTVTLSTAASAGSAATLMRSDAAIAAFDATAPTTSAVGDAAAVGSINFAARRDHTHGREAFGNVVALAIGAASANGTSTSVSHADHNHGWPSGGAQKFAADIGDGSTTAIVVTHSLGTKDIGVFVRDNTTPFAYFEVDYEATSTTTATLRFSVAPTTNQYRVIIFA